MVTLLLLSTGLFVLGLTSAWLMAWAYGSEARLPFDRSDDAPIRLAKAGLDVTYGTLPIVAAVGAQLLTPEQTPTPATTLAQALGCIGYVVVYLRWIRPRMARHRLACRARALAGLRGH